MSGKQTETSSTCRPGVPAGGAVYGLGFIGAAVYYLQHATTVWIGVIGIVKALIWPALIVYKLIELLKI